MNDQGVPVEFHPEGCGVWADEDCDCVHSMSEEDMGMDETGEWWDEDIVSKKVDTSEYDYWEDDNPPRASKSAKPKMGVSGRSIFDLVRKMAGRGKK